MKLTVNPQNIPQSKKIEEIFQNIEDMHYHQEIYEKALNLGKSIPRVESIFLVGSIADGTADFFSDIDFYIICLDKKDIQGIQDKFMKNINEIAPVIHIYRSNAKKRDVIVYFKPFIKFELVIETAERLSRNWKIGESSRLLFDRNGIGNEVMVASKSLSFNLDKHMNEISNLAIELPSFCYIISGYLIRGEIVTTIDFISWIRRKMLRISGFLLGIWDEGTRRAELRFPKELIIYYQNLRVGKDDELWKKLLNILDWYSNWMVPRFESHNILHANAEVKFIRDVINLLKQNYQLLNRDH